MKFISLFAGVGGFDLALTRLGHECVYANEWDKYCKTIYEKNFIRELDGRSIVDVSTDEIPDHELLVGGFPCQSFSIAGKRGGFDDTRGTMFFEIARILRAKQPRLFILENVKGLLSHDNGRTFKTIIATLTELGYDLQWQVLNSKNFGVPQNRERVFIVGHLRGTPRPQVFPFGSGDQINHRANGQGNNIAHTLSTSDKHRGDYIKQMNNPTHSNNRIYSEEGISPTLNTMGGGNRQPFVAMKYGQNNPERNGNTSEDMFTLKAGGSNAGVTDGARIRSLTPTECERLQGFPDNWTSGVSDTQRYKQMGNAVTVNVVYEIAKLITNLA